MHILKSGILIKHVLIAVLFFSFSAFTPTLPHYHHQSVKPLFNEIHSIIHDTGAIELDVEKAAEALELQMENEVIKKEPSPKTNIIVDDVVVMLQDVSTENHGFAAVSDAPIKDNIFPFPG